MAKIESVDYKSIPRDAKAMRTKGQELNKEIADAYKSVKELHTDWYGKRYNDLVKEFNKLIPQLNDMLTLVVKEIPSTLETIANNYSQADEGAKVTTVDTTGPSKIETLIAPNDVGMKFITERVETAKNKISTNFTNAKSKMGEIETQFGKVKWQSEAASAFKTKLSSLKNDITQAFDEINRAFGKLMNQTMTDIQSAETSNTVK